MYKSMTLLACDRDFTCGRCKTPVPTGASIAMFFPQKHRYCESCGLAVSAQMSGMPIQNTQQPAPPSAAHKYDEIEKRLTALENKPSASSFDTSKYVEVKTYSDKQTSIWRELETLNQKLTRLETRLDSIE